MTQAKAMKVASTLGWAAIALAVILMLFSGANRLGQMTLDPVTASELDVRYIQHPWVSLLHIVPGVLFLTLAPLQFVARIRRRRISIHRGLGRILATCAAISGVILMLFSGANRLGQMTLDPVTASELDVRYIQHPWVSLLHIVPGVLFLTLAPLQFVARIRRRRISIHRGLGRILATCAAISGVIVLVLNVVFPAFGGISTQTATAFFGVIFLFSLAMAIRHILRKEVRQHREWMIRTFALAVGVATVRVFFCCLAP